MGVKINLEDIGINAADFLRELGSKLTGVFEAAYACRLEEDTLKESLNNMINAALEFQTLDVSYRRIFVIGIIEIFHRLKAQTALITKAEAQQIFRSKVKMLSNAEKEEVESEEF
jgi:hypothetical protein